MAETLISPGVFLQENDQSQITSGPIEAGAAIIGPTVMGPVNIPTLVTSYSQYKAKYGTTFVSGGAYYEYLTSMAVLNYFQQGGSSLLVTRVVSGSYTEATASVPSIATLTAGTAASTTFNFTTLGTPGSGSFVINGINFIVSGSSVPANTSNTIYVPTGSNTAGTMGNFTASINASSSLYGYNISASNISTTTLTLTSTIKGTIGNNYYITSGSTTTYLNGGVDIEAFKLGTLSTGIIMNNDFSSSLASQGVLPSGSLNNIRWEITAVDTGSGLFSINVRQGDDYQNSKTVLESWNNLSLDPTQANYIEYVIGNQVKQPVLDSTTGDYYIQTSGSYTNKSNYIYVKSVYAPTPSYFNASGQISNASYTGSFPLLGSGSYNGAFGGAIGALYGSFGKEAVNMFENIKDVSSVITTANSNIQGVHAADYNVALSLLENTDAYQFNIVYAPGLTSTNAPSQIGSLLTLAQGRGDNIAVIDMVSYGNNIGTVINQATTYDNSYGATYWPWLQVRSVETGRLNFVPASTLIPAVYEYNDKIGAEWFAPAGFTRGGMGTVLQPERRLTINDRNLLYAGKVNPIGNFPGVGTVVYGQKTLQAKASALDRVNVRRLLIALKSYIGQVAENLVFEPNTQVTRNKFLNQVNPYLESVQQRQGLYSFQVVMDETNNTPDVVDRNQLVGAIYIQPTRTAEFITLTFNILPTGISFSA